jgi:ribonuclease P protein component
VLDRPKRELAMQGDERFPRCNRLRLRADFAHVYAKRCRARSGPLVVYVAPNGLDRCRLGLSIGKRVGNAVRRNRVRRRLREAFRKIQAGLPNEVEGRRAKVERPGGSGKLPAGSGLDIVCVAYPGAEELRAGLKDTFRSLVLQALTRSRV